MYSIILCGGSGTRLWPLSRKNFPKQFLNLYGKHSLLQETYLRMREIMPPERILFVTNTENLFNVVNQIKEVDKGFVRENVLTEPASLNTAPAAAFAVKHLIDKQRASHDSPVIMLPSDHYIGDRDSYLNLVKTALRDVGDNIGTIGITPTRPDTGYGYIRKGAKAGSYYRALEFKEKPDAYTALAYIDSGEYVWNSGMYLFSLRGFVREVQEHCPEINSVMALSYEDFLKNFSSMPDISFDYAISEKSGNVVIFEGEFGWNDIGSFDNLAEIDARESSRHISIDSKNVFTLTASDRLIATIGVEDLVIVENNDSILIQKKGRSQDIKKIVELLKEKGIKELEHNIVVHRPWGRYEVLIDNPNHKVKKIVVCPGAKLSLQKHYHRAEHWVVVKGMAKIVLGDKDLFLKENESTFIPALTTHRLENPGKIDLELVEVQTGSYLEEDDIIREEDIYNRLEK